MQNLNSKIMLPHEKDAIHFDKSLRELRNLRSQLDNAAQLCESTFLKAKHKKKVVENTKEYVCRAMVTVVDHIGCVSDHLESIISKPNSFSDVHLRIDCLKQRFALSEQYNQKLALRRFQFMNIVPRHRPRYISTTIEDSEKLHHRGLRDCKNEATTKSKEKHKVFEIEDDVPLFMYTSSHKPNLSKDENNSASSLVAVRDELSIISKAPNHSFHFEERKKVPARRSRQRSDILALLRRAKRTT